METVKIDVMQLVKDAKGRDYPLQDGDEPLRVRDLVYTAMGDDQPTTPGVVPAQAPADEKRRRWRISTQVMACNGELELSRQDVDYIGERAALLLTTQAFGFLDMEFTKAIGQSVPADPPVSEDAPPAAPGPA